MGGQFGVILAVLAALGTLLARLGGLLGRLGGILRPLGAVLAHLGGVLGRLGSLEPLVPGAVAEVQRPLQDLSGRIRMLG